MKIFIVIKNIFLFKKKNPKIVKASGKLKELCEKFEKDIIGRSKAAREKANLPPEATRIPDYRQLLRTSKFDNFTRCTCDESNQLDGARQKKCSEHKRRRASDGGSSSETSSDSSDSESSNSSSSRSNSSTNSRSSSCDSKENTGEKKEENKKKTKEDEFEDIRSMEINRKQNHPERLHPELSFNEPEQVYIYKITILLKLNHSLIDLSLKKD